MVATLSIATERLFVARAIQPKISLYGSDMDTISKMRRPVALILTRQMAEHLRDLAGKANNPFRHCHSSP